MSKHTVHVFGYRGTMGCYQDVPFEEAAQRYFEYITTSVQLYETVEEMVEAEYYKTIEHDGVFEVYDIWEH